VSDDPAYDGTKISAKVGDYLDTAPAALVYFYQTLLTPFFRLPENRYPIAVRGYL